MTTDIGVWIQLIMLFGALGGMGLIAVAAYNKGRKDEKYKQVKADNKQLDMFDKERTSAKPSTSDLRERMRDGKF